MGSCGKSIHIPHPGVGGTPLFGIYWYVPYYTGARLCSTNTLPPPPHLPVQPQWMSCGSQFGILQGLVSYKQVDINFLVKTSLLLKFPIHSNDCSLKMGLPIKCKMVIFIFVQDFCHKTLMCRVTGGSHPALEYLNTVDNKKCKYAIHIGVLQ